MPNEAIRALQARNAVTHDPREQAIREALETSRQFLPLMGGSIRGSLGQGQVLPSARDAIEILKRLQGGLSRVPTSARKLAEDVPISQSVKDLLHPGAQNMMEKMYNEAQRRMANPIGERLRMLEDAALRRFNQQGGQAPGVVGKVLADKRSVPRIDPKTGRLLPWWK